ncbi:hypothetical protein [Streptomyces sp. FIT100]|uniref:hypothetical protein n=1 Tax=Streptomyces sp. FIT100 TaxID=2837956 RepID=UPI0021C86051|nr:hypothetical protein [Streptomyces sp. FIT100]UUN28922.1 hypothetical protein KK483_22965 [Streptomyces sp. FIT100]
MSGGGAWGSGRGRGRGYGRGYGRGGYGPPGRHGPGGGSELFFALIRSWAAAVIVYFACGLLFAKALLEPLATTDRLEVFGWRLALLHVPGIVTTVLTVLVAARVLPEPQRDSRPVRLFATLTVPLAALGYGYAVSWRFLSTEGLLMPVVALATGAAIGIALDRLLEGRGGDNRTPAAYPYTWRDHGATALEYLGVVVVVVAVILAVSAAGIGGRVGARIQCAIASLTGSGGGNCVTGPDGTARPKTDADYEPKLCQVSSISDTAGGKVKIGWFEWGEEYGFQQKVSQANTDVNGDGKVDGDDKLVYMTFTDAASAGVNASTPGVKLGKLGKADVDLGGGIKVTNGDTWVFKSEADAERMREDIEEMKMWETSMTHSGAYGGGNWYAAKEWAEKKEAIERQIGDKKISYSTIGLYAQADGGLGIKAGDDTRLGAKLGGKAKFSPDVTITKDDVNGNESYTYTAKLEIEGKVSGEAGPLGGTAGAKDSYTGAITVTRDQKTGKLVRIDMTKTFEGTQTSDKTEVGGDNGKKKDEKRGGKGGVTDSSGPTGIEVQTNSIVFGKETDQMTEDKRAVAEQWLDGSGNNTAPFEYMFGDKSLEQKPEGNDPFDQLMFQDGLSSTLDYHGEIDAQEFGFEVSLGMSLGFSVSSEQKKETLTNARFLGAPQGDKRTSLPYSYCAK